MKVFLKPTNGTLTSKFGVRTHPVTGKKTFHQGIDISNHEDNNIYAAYDGLVYKVLPNSYGYGNLIMIQHEIAGKRWDTVYAHLAVIGVQQGQRVKKGEKIGVKGTTGISTGIHLHFEIVKGKWTSDVDSNLKYKNNVDPMLYIEDFNANPTNYTNASLKVESLEDYLDVNLPNEPMTTHKEDYEWAKENNLINRENSQSLIRADQLATILKRFYDKMVKS